MFWTVNGKKIKKMLLILVTAFFAALVAFVQSEEVAVFSTSEGPAALSKVKTDKKQVALTFDVGWGDVRIEPILDFLAEKEVDATFFISGLWAEHHSEIVEEIEKKGFEIGSHGMRHVDYTNLEKSELRRDIIQAKDIIKKITGEVPELLRPPMGNINKEIIKTANALKQEVIMWSVNPQDTSSPGYKDIAVRTIKETDKGEIILLHASDSAKQTLHALPMIINELKDNGFKFVTVSELISNAKINNKPIK